eukprot:gnl/TRDRNA2_/TRDRNA2_188264_c0_seq1.p1 gnl/TRDRNA2_/TRDRNA2_188264_c0~~gnl/TRDRNA2_/TRDRNA2_188264_c0_seq1.p1  ORF type:complete len:435 (+),score=84.01 gnl/TRDRNA2_/TRDRNA2_188264_c0_seq1:55-1359(+)
MGCHGSKAPDPMAGLEVFVKYDMGRRIGAGSTCVVHEATDKVSGQIFAVKCVVKEEAEAQRGTEKVGEADYQNEVTIMRKLQHEHCCKLFDVFEDDVITYVVLELCEGEKLFDKLEEHIVLEEREAARYMYEMAMAIGYLHRLEIIHRDLKPENWIFSQMGAAGRIKLINFGLATIAKPSDCLSNAVGTLHYVAPEVIRGHYGLQADLWTLGVVAFLMIYGTYPFDGQSLNEVMQMILGSEPDYTDSCFALSEDLKNLLKRLLVKDPDMRMTSANLLAHPWFRSSGVMQDVNMEQRRSTAQVKRCNSVASNLGSNLGNRGGGDTEIKPTHARRGSVLVGHVPSVAGGRRCSTMLSNDIVAETRQLQMIAEARNSLGSDTQAALQAAAMSDDILSDPEEPTSDRSPDSSENLAVPEASACRHPCAVDSDPTKSAD